MAEKETERMLMISFDTEQIIFEEGATEQWMYKIISGSVNIFKKHNSSHPILLKTLTKGMCFGEMALLESLPRSATAVCHQNALLLRIPQSEFSVFIAQYPQNALDIMKTLSAALRNTTTKLEESYDQLLEIALNKKEPEPHMLSMLERRSTYNPETSRYEFIV